MEKIAAVLEKIGLPFAYDHFAESESPNPPFICYLLTIGMVNDMYAESGNDEYKGYSQMATQKDFDAF